jgi:CheY-like chemotaxis protein
VRDKKEQGVADMDTILIVDDSSFIIEGLLALLKTKYHALAAYSGAGCLDLLTTETPAVIILDIMMEPMDGWETLARIRENPRTRQIPVLMFSAKKISPEEADEHRISIDDFITKPVSPKKIIEAIEKVLARRDTHRTSVGRWISAGISQEKIDEYLSLVTSLEVDLSLCQNMKIQCDIIQPREKDQSEFPAVIAAIEERIRQVRGLIDTLAHGMNDALEQTSVEEGTEAVPEPGFRPKIPVPEGTDTQPRTAEPVPGLSPADVPPPPVIPPLSQTGPDEVLSMIPQGETVPSAEMPKTTGPDLQENGDASTNDAGDPHALPEVLPELAGTAPGDEKPVLVPVSTLEGTWVKPDATGGLEIPHTFPERERSPDAPDTIPDDDDIMGYRPVVPADPDAFRVSGNEPLTGAGTDVPMVWDRYRERKKAVTHSPAQPGSSAPVSPAPQGLVARIIAMITGLLRKK